MSRARDALHNLGRGDNQREERITTCKICIHGVYKWQTWVWLSGAVTGIVHADCAQRQVTE